MKRIFFLSLVTIFFLVATAQQGATPEQRAQRFIDGQAFTSLNLTTEQKVKALAIIVAEYKSLDSLSVTVQGAANEAIQTKRMAIMQASEVKFKELLNGAQKTTYTSIVQARPQGVGFGQMGGPQGGNRTNFTPEVRAQQIIGGWLFEPLNLNAEQKTKAQAILTDEYKALDEATAGIPQNLSFNERQAQIAALAPKLSPIRAA
ncbi:MAG: hypothetical protein M3342_23830, partial [Bacteroidota bacterium]|nr:hypothetical protein [Bacteroidota bacterium]